MRPCECINNIFICQDQQQKYCFASVIHQCCIHERIQHKLNSFFWHFTRTESFWRFQCEIASIVHVCWSWLLLLNDCVRIFILWIHLNFFLQKLNKIRLVLCSILQESWNKWWKPSIKIRKCVEYAWKHNVSCGRFTKRAKYSITMWNYAIF